MRIQEIADTIGLSKKAINLYEKKGLLQVIRDENGYRCYTQEHVRILMRIKILRRMDVFACGYRTTAAGEKYAAAGYAEGTAGEKACAV